MIPRLLLSLLVALVLLAVLEWRFQALSRFASEKSTALNLAIARIVVAANLLWQIRLHEILVSASIDPVLRVPFRIWGFLAVHLVASPAALTAIYSIFAASACLMLIGLFGRAASAVCAIATTYLVSTLFIYGKVDHIYHHLVFFSLICAVFPSSDALSLDAVWTKRRNADLGDSRAGEQRAVYGYAMRCMWIFIGLAYFFPGLWKFSRSWLYWFSGNALHDYIPLGGATLPLTPSALWLLHHPGLLPVCAILVLVFELGFIFAILFRALRPFAAVAGLMFHTLSFVVLGISFISLATCYVVFVDWSALLSRIRRKAAVSREYRSASQLRPVPPFARGVALAALSVMIVMGLFHVVESWPVSCFPAFDGPFSDTVRQASLQFVDSKNTAQDWNLSTDSKMWARYPRWHWLANEGLGESAVAGPKVAALVHLWFKAHPEFQPEDVVVSVDTYQMIPLSGKTVRLARKKTWEFTDILDPYSPARSVRR